MEYRRLGKSGLKVSALSLGAWVTFGQQIGVDEALEIMAAAYDRGCNFFDNAEAYARGKAETIMGEALQKAGWRRDSYLVSSKVFGGSVEKPLPIQRGLSRKHVYEAVLSGDQAAAMRLPRPVFLPSPGPGSAD